MTQHLGRSRTRRRARARGASRTGRVALDWRAIRLARARKRSPIARTLLTSFLMAPDRTRGRCAGGSPRPLALAVVASDWPDARRRGSGWRSPPTREPEALKKRVIYEGDVLYFSHHALERTALARNCAPCRRGALRNSTAHRVPGRSGSARAVPRAGVFVTLHVLHAGAALVRARGLRSHSGRAARATVSARAGAANERRGHSRNRGAAGAAPGCRQLRATPRRLAPPK